MSSNVCGCPNPPGGQVVCEASQAAACIVDANGHLLGTCVTIASARSELRQLYETILYGPLDPKPVYNYELKGKVSSLIEAACGIPSDTLQAGNWLAEPNAEGITLKISWSQTIRNGPSTVPLNQKMPGESRRGWGEFDWRYGFELWMRVYASRHY